MFRLNSSWVGETRETFKLAWPLVAAQMAQHALQTTDVIMMGWLGPESLAAGSLGSSVMFPLFLFCIGTVSAVATLVSQALGARDLRSVRRAVRQGMWVAFLLCSIVIAMMFFIKDILLLLGQQEETANLAATYIEYASWAIIPGCWIIVLRSFVSAHGSTMVVLLITIIGIFVNALGNYALMFGNFGFPRLELAGAGISTALVNSVMFLLILIYILLHRRFRRYEILVRFWKPDWPSFIGILKLGTPIGLMLTAETGLFAFAFVMMGWISTDALAAHAVALQLAGISFMVPLGLSLATNIRVGLAYGRKSNDGIMRAGWVSIIMAVAFMSVTCVLFLTIPGPLVSLFLDTELSRNAIPLMLAGQFLAVAGLFQLVDGAQVIAASALRGLGDTAVPMYAAIFGYWACGAVVSYIFGFVFGWGGVGIWSGLAVGLGFVAVVLVIRFAMRERLGLLPVAS